MRMPAEILQIYRFSVVGCAATVVHLGIVLGLGAHTQMSTLVVHLTGFLGAFSISFAGHYLYTFKSTQRWQSALFKFLAMSLMLLLLSSLVLKLCALAGLTRSVRLIISAISIPVLSYVINKKLVFQV